MKNADVFLITWPEGEEPATAESIATALERKFGYEDKEGTWRSPKYKVTWVSPETMAQAQLVGIQQASTKNIEDKVGKKDWDKQIARIDASISTIMNQAPLSLSSQADDLAKLLDVRSRMENIRIAEEWNRREQAPNTIIETPDSADKIIVLLTQILVRLNELVNLYANREDT